MSQCLSLATGRVPLIGTSGDIRRSPGQVSEMALEVDFLPRTRDTFRVESAPEKGQVRLLQSSLLSR